MTDEKKYLKLLHTRLVLEIELGLLEVLRPFLDQAGIPYEVLDAPPEEEGENTRRRRSS